MTLPCERGDKGEVKNLQKLVLMKMGKEVFAGQYYNELDIILF